MTKKKIILLGSTGSIGESCLEVVRHHPDQFEVVGLVAHQSVAKLKEQIEEFKPSWTVVGTNEAKDQLSTLLGSAVCSLYVGLEAASELVLEAKADVVVSAIVGAAGLKPTVAAIKAKSVLALANKESMVVAGDFINALAEQYGATILPVDSEHSAIFQCLEQKNRAQIKSITLTASGGPFFKKTSAELSQVTLKQALKHPNWSMGAKITIDSATMMNKGLEVIEAHHLFKIGFDKIKVCIHPQSIVHSMVSYVDGSTIAQMGLPDMKTPIAYALSYPRRIFSGVDSLDLTQVQTLEFFAPDLIKFKCLNLALSWGAKGQTYPAVLNAANEVAVAAFLKEKISFLAIAEVIEKVLTKHQPKDPFILENVLASDQWARTQTQGLIDLL